MKNAFNGLFIVFFIILFTSCNSKETQEVINEDSINSVDTRQVNEPGKYCNDKYGFCINYPQDDFTVGNDTETDEGIVFVSNDGFAKLIIHRGNLDTTITEGPRLKEAYEEDLKPKGKREVTYHSFGTTDYTLMGYENKTIFYQKTIIKKGVIATAILYYEDSAKDIYYPMLQPIFKSFK